MNIDKMIEKLISMKFGCEPIKAEDLREILLAGKEPSDLEKRVEALEDRYYALIPEKYLKKDATAVSIPVCYICNAVYPHRHGSFCSARWDAPECDCIKCCPEAAAVELINAQNETLKLECDCGNCNACIKGAPAVEWFDRKCWCGQAFTTSDKNLSVCFQHSGKPEAKAVIHTEKCESKMYDGEFCSCNPEAKAVDLLSVPDVDSEDLMVEGEEHFPRAKPQPTTPLAEEQTPNNDGYFAGKGCICNAYGECECGCGADWTDPEIYTLRAKVKRLSDPTTIRINRGLAENFLNEDYTSRDLDAIRNALKEVNG